MSTPLVRIILSESQNSQWVILKYRNGTISALTVEITLQTVRIKKGNIEIEVPYETEEERNKILAGLLGTEEGGYRSTNVSVSTTEKRGKFVLPRVDQIVEFISGKPDFVHTIPQVGLHFNNGKPFLAGSGNPDYVRLRNRVMQAHLLVSQRNKGRWVELNNPDSKKVKLFKFERAS